MIYLFYGTDRPKIRRRINEVTESFFDVFWITVDQFNRSKFDELIEARGLFASNHAVVCDRLFESKDAIQYILSKLEDLKQSQNVFIFAEGELDGEVLGEFKKFSNKIEELSEVRPRQNWRGRTSDSLTSGNFNIFSLCDALGERNRKNLWILFNKALQSGVPLEQIFWKLVWQVKNLCLAKKAKGGAKELIDRLKMSPFVAGKAVKYSNGWTESELTSLYKDLLDTYHNSRRGVVELESALEKIILR